MVSVLNKFQFIQIKNGLDALYISLINLLACPMYLHRYVGRY